MIYECAPIDALLVKAEIERSLRDVIASIERRKLEESKKAKERADARQRLLDAARDAVAKQK